MKIYDISQEVFSCRVYPGDPEPQMQLLARMDKGDKYNLTAFSMCAHNGTHIDAPRHFIAEGKDIAELPLECTVGEAYVCPFDGEIDETAAQTILQKAAGIKRILIKGSGVLVISGARTFAEAGIKLVGSESQSVGDENAPMAVHLVLLGAGVALLEGVRLQSVPEGRYFLCAQPLKLAGADGAPCRAILIQKEEGELLW